jgi:hypothetical protein
MRFDDATRLLVHGLLYVAISVVNKTLNSFVGEEDFRSYLVEALSLLNTCYIETDDVPF